MKALLAITLAMILLVALAVPVLADQPENPGSFGQEVRTEAQNDEGPGISPEVQFLQAWAEEEGTTMGQLLKSFLRTEFGIPPKHTP